MKINKCYWNLSKYTERYIVVYGGRRSGKSFGVSQLLAVRAGLYKRQIVVMRKVARTIRLSVFPRMISALQDAGIPIEVNKSDMVIKLFNGSQFWFVGADDPEKLKSLEGATDYWLEEAPEFDEQDFNVIDAGLSAPCDPPPQIFLTFNPIPQIPGHQHWLQRRFLPSDIPIAQPIIHDNIVVLRTTYKQNTFCPEETKKVLEGYKQKHPDLYRMWALGEFVTMEGAILDDWDTVDKVPDGVQVVGYGLDFGFANDPATVVKVYKHNDDFYVDELLYETGLTNQALGLRMKQMGISHNDIIRADSAEPKSIAELKEMGFTVLPSEKSPDYKRAAAQWLRSKHLHLINGSTNLIREIASWSWDRDKHGNQLPKPADGDDHTVDALIYAVYKKERPVLIGRA